MAAVHPTLQDVPPDSGALYRLLAELRATQERLRALIGTEPECVKLLDAQGRLLEMNAAGLRMIEADAAEAVLGQCVYGLLVPEHAAAFRSLTERVCRGERGSLEFELIGLKGTRRWLETHAVPFRDEDSGETRLLAITRDITERRRLAEALAESERRFRTFMDNAPAVAWIKDAALRYTYVNQAFAQYHGRSAAQMLGRNDFDLFPSELATYFRVHDDEVRSGGGAMQTLRKMPQPDGSTRHWLAVKFPFADASGGSGIAGFAVDVSARVDAEDKARRYAEDVRSLVNRVVQAQEAERRRVADELHDLIGQNLTALGIDLQALKHRLQSGGDLIAGPRLDAMAMLVETTIDAIRGVMTDLRPAALEEFGLLPALRWHASVFGERTGIKVTTQASGPEVRLSRDAELAVFRIVQETLTNVAKHSGAANVKIAVRYGDGVSLSVQDDGRGLAEAADARSAKLGGFGLTTMRERAEAYGGRLRIESAGRGTRVVVEMPKEGNAD
jgi:PAS domain S-box-containing protein